MKRILVVSQHFWPENFRINDICNGFLEHEIEVDVLCGLPNYPKGEYFSGYSYTKPRKENLNGINIFRAGEIRRKGNTSIRIFLNYISFPLFALFNLPRLKSRHYDAVFCYNTSPVYMMLPAIVYSKIKKVPLTTYVLDLWPENLYSVLPIKNKFLCSVLKSSSHYLYKKCDKLISLSDAMQDKVKLIAPNAKHIVIPQYCEDFYFNETYDEDLKNKFKGKFNVLFAGNISPAQNLELLLYCAKRLKSENNNNIHFIIVGDGMSKDDLQNIIKKDETTDYFTFVGQKNPEEIPNYQSVADALFAALAKSDDLGLTVPAKITSYLAAAKPCLVAIDGEGANTVLKAKAGFVCSAGDENALYENLIKLANLSEIEREEMGKNAREYCALNFGRKQLLNNLINFIL